MLKSVSDEINPNGVESLPVMEWRRMVQIQDPNKGTI